MSGSDWRKQTKARKTHQCEICRNQILPGEVYRTRRRLGIHRARILAD